jgi:hypothetical protein
MKGMSMDRNGIELIVDEPVTGHFYWLLQKQDDGRPRVVDQAAGPMPSHGSAMMAGITALERRVERRRGANTMPMAGARLGSRYSAGPMALQ